MEILTCQNPDFSRLQAKVQWKVSNNSFAMFTFVFLKHVSSDTLVLNRIQQKLSFLYFEQILSLLNQILFDSNTLIRTRQPW